MHDATPKLSPALFQAYKAYKRDTDRLATWLGDTARSIGFELSPRPNAKGPAVAKPAAPIVNSAPQAPRLKGKARKAAKQQQQQAAAGAGATAAATAASKPTKDPEILTATSLTVAQLIACAQYIADSDPPVRVPTKVIDWVCRAISARRICANWFQSPTSGDGFDVGDESEEEDSAIQSNRTHAFFIAALEEVVSILAPRVGTPSEDNGGAAKAAPANAGRATKPVSGVELLQSRFAALRVKESSPTHHAGNDSGDDDDSGDAGGWDSVFQLVQETLSSKPSTAAPPTSPQRKKTKSNRAKSETDHLRRLFRLHCEGDEEQDFVFVLMEHLEALDMLSDQVRDVWPAYLYDHLDGISQMGSLEHASLLTMAVCDKAHDMCNDLTKQYPGLMYNYRKYTTLVYEHACADSNLEPWAASETPSGEKLFGKRAWSLAMYSFLPTLVVLERFRKAVKTGTVQRRARPDDIGCPCCHGCEMQQQDHLDYMESVVNDVYLYYQEAEALKADFSIAAIPNPVIAALESLKTLSLYDPIPLSTLFTVQLFISVTSPFDRIAPDLGETFLWTDVSLTLGEHMDALEQYKRCPPTTSTGDLYMPRAIDALSDLPFELYLWLGDDFGTDSESDGGDDDDDDDSLFTKLRRRQAVILRLFMRHPWFAGLVVARAGVCMSQTAVSLADPWQSVTNAAYIYQAMRLVGLDKEEEAGIQDASSSQGDTEEDDHDHDDCGSKSDGSRLRDTHHAAHPGGIKDTSWWSGMSRLMAFVGRSRVFYGKEPSDLHSLWRTLNLTLRNRSRTDVVFRPMLQKPRHGRTGGLPRSLHGIVSKNPCKPQSKSIVTLHGLFDKRRVDLVGQSFTERLLGRKASQGTESARVKAVVSSMHQAISPRMAPTPHDPWDEYEFPATRELAAYMAHVSDALREYVDLAVPNLLMLHVQSVPILKHLRAQILDHDRVWMLDVDCEDCRWRDTHLPASVWNVVRALGGAEVTEPVLGPVQTRQEKEDAVALLADLKDFIVTMRPKPCPCADCPFKSNQSVEPSNQSVEPNSEQVDREE